MADANDVKEMSDDELSEAVDRIPLDLVAGDPPVVKEWVERARVHRQLEKIGIHVTRAEAIQISRHILKDAERGRIEVAEQEAKQGAMYMDEKTTDLRDRCGITELLKVRQERRLKHGGELKHTRDTWSFALRLLYGAIEKASEERWHFPDEVLYPLVADLGAACLAYMQAMNANASTKEDRNGIDS